MNKATRVELGGTRPMHEEKTNNVMKIELRGTRLCARKGDRKGSER
jgi:hypothetical protein